MKVIERAGNWFLEYDEDSGLYTLVDEDDGARFCIGDKEGLAYLWHLMNNLHEKGIAPCFLGNG